MKDKKGFSKHIQKHYKQKFIVNKSRDRAKMPDYLAERLIELDNQERIDINDIFY